MLLSAFSGLKICCAAVFENFFALTFVIVLQLGFENRDPGSGNSRDLMNFLASRVPGFLTKIPGIFSTVTQSKLNCKRFLFNLRKR